MYKRQTFSAPDAEDEERWASVFTYGNTLVYSGSNDNEGDTLYSGSFYIYDVTDLTATPTKVLNPTPDQSDSFAFQVA